MQKHFIFLFALSTSFACLGMENNKEIEQELQKSIVIQHNGLMKRMRSSSDNKTLFFGIQNTETNTYGAQVYDIKNNKIIKTCRNRNKDEPLIFLLNKKLPSYYALSKMKNNKNYCSLYDLNQNSKKIITLEKGNKPYQFGFARNGKIFFALYENLFKSYDIINETYKEFWVEEGTLRFAAPSPDGNHLIFFVEGETLDLISHYDIEKNHHELLVPFQCDPLPSIKTTSTHIVFTDKINATINLYDMQKHEIIKKLKTKKPVVHYILLSDETVLFTCDSKNFVLWNPENDELCDVVSVDKEYDMQGAMTVSSGQSSDIIYFYDKREYCTTQINFVYVYDVERKKTYTLKAPETSGALFINDQARYAAYNRNTTMLDFYTTDTWELLHTLTFENAQQVSLTFSPDGNYAAITCLEKNDDNENKLYKGATVHCYDIKNGTLIFKTPALETAGSWFATHDTLVALKSDTTTLTLFNYKDATRADITTQEEITHFFIGEDFVSISSGQQTEIFSREKLTFTLIESKGYCTIL